MRVVSLAPSATAVIEELGLADSLVATTNHTQSYDSVGGWLTPDVDKIAEYDPDLVITTDALQDEIAVRLDNQFSVAHYEPVTLRGVEHSIRKIGQALNRPALGVAGAHRFRRQLRRLSYTPTDERPIIYCEEWMDPPMAAGNWVPELVALAGGQYPYNTAGQRSEQIDAALLDTQPPDIIVSHVCGKGKAVDPDFKQRGWSAPAIEADNTTIIHDDMLNQPSFALIDGLEELRKAVWEWERNNL